MTDDDDPRVVVQQVRNELEKAMDRLDGIVEPPTATITVTVGAGDWTFHLTGSDDMTDEDFAIAVLEAVEHGFVTRADANVFSDCTSNMQGRLVEINHERNVVTFPKVITGQQEVADTYNGP